MSAYLDYNASSPLRPGVFAAMRPWLEEHCGNAHSVHRAGRLARQAVESAREQIATLLGARPAEIYFTSGATEANNWALTHLLQGRPRAVGATEHDAVLQADPAAEVLPVAANGEPDPAALDAVLGREPGLLSLMWANNETGVVNDIPSLCAKAQLAGWQIHSDATQAIARLPVDFASSGLAALSCSAHKLGGPKGVGALVLREGLSISPWQHGGGHERGLRSGTLNVAGIVGFGEACRQIATLRSAESERLAAWRDHFEHELIAAIPGSRVFAAEATRMSNTSFFSLPDFHSEALLMELDKRGFALASGSACHSGSDTPSHVLAAMGVPTAEALGAVRMSLGHATTEGEVLGLLQALGAIVHGAKSGIASSLLNS